MRKNIVYFLLGLFLSGFFNFFLNFSEKKLEDFFYAEIIKPFEEKSFVKIEKKPKKPPLELEVKSAFSLKINKWGTEKILYQKEAEKILPIASLTKLVSALIVLKNPEDYPLGEEISVSSKAAEQVDVPESGNLKTGEKIKVKELLGSMLYWSSNDAAFALAEKIGIEKFIQKMNEEAENLELKNTHFVNPTGLDPEKMKWEEENKEYFNYSTAKDLIVLGKYLLKEFPIIFEFSNYREKITLLPSQQIIGIKTGYTLEAGGCLFLVFNDEKENYYLNVILGAKDKDERFQQMQKLVNWINGKI